MSVAARRGLNFMVLKWTLASGGWQEEAPAEMLCSAICQTRRIKRRHVNWHLPEFWIGQFRLGKQPVNLGWYCGVYRIVEGYEHINLTDLLEEITRAGRNGPESGELPGGALPRSPATVGHR